MGKANAAQEVIKARISSQRVEPGSTPTEGSQSERSGYAFSSQAKARSLSPKAAYRQATLNPQTYRSRAWPSIEGQAKRAALRKKMAAIPPETPNCPKSH